MYNANKRPQIEKAKQEMNLNTNRLSLTHRSDLLRMENQITSNQCT